MANQRLTLLLASAAISLFKHEYFGNEKRDLGNQLKKVWAQADHSLLVGADFSNRRGQIFISQNSA